MDPDGFSSPTFLKQNFNGKEAADLYQAVHLHTLEDLAEQGPYPKVISQLALRIITYEYPLEAILAIYFLSATGYLPDKFPLDQWIEAVKWHGDTKIAAIIQTEAEWAGLQPAPLFAEDLFRDLLNESSPSCKGRPQVLLR